MVPGSTARCEANSASETVLSEKIDQQCPDAAAVIQAIYTRIESLQSFGQHTLLQLIALDQQNRRGDVSRDERADMQTRKSLEERRYHAAHLEQVLLDLKNGIKATSEARLNITEEKSVLRLEIDRERERWCELDKNRIELEAAQTSTRNNPRTLKSSSKSLQPVGNKCITSQIRFRS